MDQDERAQRRQSRTIVLAALIGAIGAVLAAVAGHWQGREQGADQQVDLQNQLDASSAEIAELRKALAEQAQNVAALQERLKQARRDPSIVPGNSNPGPQASEQVEKLVSNYRFVLRGCSAEGSNIVCSFVVTNLAGDRDFELSYQSGMIDGAGEPHQAERIFAGRELRASNAGIHLVTGVATAFSFRFEGLAASVRDIALLEVKSRGFSVQWRGVPVTNA